MFDFMKALEGWGIPLIILITLAFIYVISLVVGTVCDAFGKSAPVFINIRKWSKKRKEEKKKKKSSQLDQITELLLELKNQKENNSCSNNNQEKDIQEISFIELKEFLDEIKKHYDEDNISKRDKWMLDVNSTLNWCKERAKTYDASVKELHELMATVKTQQDALDMNNKMTSDLYKQSCRSEVLEFMHRIVNARKADKPLILSREQFRKVRKTYEDYETFLKTYGGTNGEVDDAMEVIRKAERGEYSYIEFLEDQVD